MARPWSDLARAAADAWKNVPVESPRRPGDPPFPARPRCRLTASSFRPGR